MVYATYIIYRKQVPRTGLVFSYWLRISNPANILVKAKHSLPKPLVSFMKWKLIYSYRDFLASWFIREGSAELTENEFHPLNLIRKRRGYDVVKR